MGAWNSASSSALHVPPAVSIWSRRTVERTDAACGPPMTDTRAPGHSQRKRGEYARPHMEYVPAPKEPPTTTVSLGTDAQATAFTIFAPCFAMPPDSYS